MASDGPNVSIGEIGQTVFSCPACSRPLALGARRCPGCGSRLLMGVQLGRVSTFVLVGLIVGVAFGGGLAAVLSAVRMPAHDAYVADVAAAAALAQAAQAQAAAPPKVAATPATGGSSGSSTGSIPAISASALRQALVVDKRLDTAAAGLTAALAASTMNVQDVSELLRAASTDSVIGLQLAQNVKSWPGGVAFGAELTAFYESVQATATDGLTNSIHNEAAYRRSARAMVELLGGLAALDARARQVGATAGLSLPAETSPAP
jgi:DNA-directed RNA polymerase subunit RPC12/RpoP